MNIYKKKETLIHWPRLSPEKDGSGPMGFS